jgi:hypothetical protein
VEHTQAVKDRIDSVGQLRDVVDITKGLFALSKVRDVLAQCSFHTCFQRIPSLPFPVSF